jgi:opacity protein-like surface antigen
MRSLRLAALSLVALAVTALPARADLTAFVGLQNSPNTRGTWGGAAGMGVLVVGFEGEYAQAHADNDCFTSTAECAPSVRTLMGNVLIQTPRGVVPKVQLYGTIGGGYYRERFESLDIEHEGVGTNVGGGAKIDLAGPLRLRVDYRIFSFGNNAIYGHPQRFSVGINLAF